MMLFFFTQHAVVTHYFGKSFMKVSLPESWCSAKERAYTSESWNEYFNWPDVTGCEGLVVMLCCIFTQHNEKHKKRENFDPCVCACAFT